MSCSERRNKKHSDFNWVISMAQNTANLTGLTQIVYERKCEGKKVYYFSDSWKGDRVRTIEPVRLIGKITDINILSNTEDRKPKLIKSRRKEDKSASADEIME